LSFTVELFFPKILLREFLYASMDKILDNV